jgi:hypothetical protein
MTRTLLILLLSTSFICSYGQEISVREEYINFPTYPFSDPDPVASPGKIYPYFRFEGYSASAISQKHKMVVMENKWIKLWIAPDIGGKIWGALDKKTGKYFIYYNNVVKFRDIAMRGPWTSGGIEFNFGSIGHAPTTVTPVDYHFRNNPDGSVSCYIGSIELTSRTEWRVEIRLPADKAWFETISYWDNPTNLKTSLYHWQTAAADVGDDLQYYFPGKAYIGHVGEASDWPVMSNGKDISIYRNNDYGSSHSYHVLGEYTDWFAGYYHNNDYGFGHWSRYPYKPGKKIWIWALSRSGAIWENLLTDPAKGSKQYTEIQTGLLYNQEADGSTMSPFKHLYFEPGAVETVKERWFPISATKGVSSISQEGILNIKKNEKGLKIVFQSLAYFKDKLQISDTSGNILHEYQLDMTPEQIFEISVELNPDNVIIRLKDGELFYDLTSRKNTILDRPLEIQEGFDWESVYGLYTKGVEKSRQRLYDAAKVFLNRCLTKDPSYIPAYTGLAEIDFKEMKYDAAEKKLLHVISFDTYDPDANFLYGTILTIKKEYNKARDAFGVTLRSPGHKSAALNQLALIALKEKRLEEAWDYAKDASLYNGLDINICKTAAVIARLRGDDVNYKMLLHRLLDIDPLCHFAEFEKYFSAKDNATKTAFTSKITNELSYETYIELALWYFNAGLENEASSVMELCPENPLADYLSGYLAFRRKDETKTNFYLERANKANDELVFPFRDEYVTILKWADLQQTNWKVKYYSAILYWSKGQTDVAEKYFTDCGETPDSYSFYISRGNLKKQTGANAESDYLKALKYGENNWRPYHMLNTYYLTLKKYDKAVDVSQLAMKKFSSLYIIRFDYSQSLFYVGKYDECIKLLETTEVLPTEGSNNGREIWENSNILNAVKYYSNNKAAKALVFADNAYKWPENLGVGKPYDVDEREEDFVKAMILDKLGRRKEAESLFGRLADYNKGLPRDGSSINYLTVLAFTRLGRQTEATVYFNRWLELSGNKMISEWAKFMNANQKDKADALIMSDSQSQTIPGNRARIDTDFRIINEIAQKYSGK